MPEVIIKSGKRTEEAPPAPQGITRWDAFDKAGLYPSEIICRAYRFFHPSDLSCKSRVRIDVEAIKAHIDPEHGSGGGFEMVLKQVPASKEKTFWRDLIDNGLEALDVRCGVCNQVLVLHPAKLMEHMKPHTGMVKKKLPGGKFFMTISSTPPLPTDEELMKDEF